MSYYTTKQLIEMSFKPVGVNVKISDKVSVYDYNQIELNKNRTEARIDDFCIIDRKNKNR